MSTGRSGAQRLVTPRTCRPLCVQDKRSTDQNSGIRVDAMDPNGNKQTCYGRIEDIWELDYVANFKVPLFLYQWVKMTGGGVTVDKEYEMTTVDLNNCGFKDEPFILAADVSQVFFVKDMSIKPKRGKNDDHSIVNEPKRHIVLFGKETLSELRTSQTCQAITKGMIEFRPS